jgi:hypothetical protein
MCGHFDGKLRDLLLPKVENTWSEAVKQRGYAVYESAQDCECIMLMSRSFNLFGAFYAQRKATWNWA